MDGQKFLVSVSFIRHPNTRGVLSQPVAASVSMIHGIPEIRVSQKVCACMCVCVRACVCVHACVYVYARLRIEGSCELKVVNMDATLRCKAITQWKAVQKLITIACVMTVFLYVVMPHCGLSKPSMLPCTQ